MKILFIVSSFPKLSETFILNQITGLINKGHEITILAERESLEKKFHPDVINYKLRGKTIYGNIPENKLNRFLVFLLKILPLLIKQPLNFFKSINFFKYGKQASNLKIAYYTAVLKKQNFDVVHSHFGTNGVVGVALKDIGAINGKVFTTFHGVDMTSYIQENGDGCYNYLFRHGTLFLPISTFWKRKLIQLGCPENKLVVHHMGVDTSRFQYKYNVEERESFKIISSARLVEKKGIEYAIKAVSSLILKGYKVKYTIIGDGPLRNSLESLIDNLNMRDNIKIVGWKQQEEIIENLQLSDLTLVPSVTSSNGDMEGIPVVIMEAMAIGLPVLSTYHSGIPEIISDEVNGFLVEEKNVPALEEKLIYIVNNPEKLKAISKQARLTIEEKFNIDTLNNTLETYFINNL